MPDNYASVHGKWNRIEQNKKSSETNVINGQISHFKKKTEEEKTNFFSSTLHKAALAAFHYRIFARENRKEEKKNKQSH